MAKTDWTMNDTVQPEDMNDIGQEINQLREDVDNIEVPPASTTQAGIVQLSNAVDSTSETMAATPNAVKQAYDHAEQAFQLGIERKEDLVDALNAIGVPASTSETWDALLGKVAGVIRATGNATAADVLTGKTFSNATANGLTGTMPDRGAVNPTLTNQGQQYTIPNGYHNGAGKVTANISNLSAGNVRDGATVGGVAGTFSRFSNGATAAQILAGRSAAVNGQAVNGSMPDRAGNQPAQAVRARNNTILGLRPLNSGYYPAGTGNWIEYNEPNWQPENIRAGVNMFGKTGTLIPLDPFVLTFDESTTWTSPFTGELEVFLVGGGGGGGAGQNAGGRDGGTSEISFNGTVLASARGGSGASASRGGDGGSGGGAGGSEGGTTSGMSGGTDGGDGGSNGHIRGGTGQGSTTREWGEPSGYIYSRGGHGGSGGRSRPDRGDDATVIGGGGDGGPSKYDGGGGGGGGYTTTTTIQVQAGETYTIIVGAGGRGGYSPSSSERDGAGGSGHHGRVIIRKK